MLQTVDAQVVLEGEQQGESPFQYFDNPEREAMMAAGDDGAGGAEKAVGHQYQDVGDDGNQQPHVESLSGRRVALEDDGEDFLLGDIAVLLWQQPREEYLMHHIADAVDNLTAHMAPVDIAEPCHQSLQQPFYSLRWFHILS